MPGETLKTPLPKRESEFGFTDREALFDRVSHERFMAFLENETTTIRQIVESSNNYGEFLFVTLQRPGSRSPIYATFWGLGFHEHRERWLSKEWFWYFSDPPRDKEDQEMTKDEALEVLQIRLEQVQAYAAQETQSTRGQLFELLADLTDEDGAWSEMEDWGDRLLDDYE